MSDIVKDTIDLTKSDKQLNELAYTDFANKVRSALLDLWTMGIDVPLNIRGTRDQIDSFMTSLKREKRYMDSYMQNGLNDPRTLSSKHELMRSVERFEKETGLRWPFKN